MPKYIDAELLEGYFKREEWNTPDEWWRPESEFGAIVDALHPADVAEVKHGKWVFLFKHKCFDALNFYKCSICGQEETFIQAERFSYCPNCGAKMDGKADD